MPYLASIDVTEAAHIIAKANDFRSFDICILSKVVANYNPLFPDGVYFDPELIKLDMKGKHALALSEALGVVARFYSELSTYVTHQVKDQQKEKVINNGKGFVTHK